LSAERANASRRELVAAGIAENKILRVTGLGEASMLDKADPLNPINRRISIIVLNRKAEESILSDGISGERAQAAAEPATQPAAAAARDSPS